MVSKSPVWKYIPFISRKPFVPPTRLFTIVASGMKVKEPSGALLLSPPKSWNPKNPFLLLPGPELVL